jgi:hypothetical protein
MKSLALVTIMFCGLFAAIIPASAQTWTQTSAPNNYWYSVACSADGSKLEAVGGGKSPNPIYISTNAGVVWTTNSSPNQVWGAIASSANGSVLIACAAHYWNTNLIYVSTNSGSTWVSNTNVPSFGSLACSADGRKWIASAGIAGIYTSTNCGTTWISNEVPAGFWLSVASSADGTKLAAVNGVISPSYARQIYVSNDSGFNWRVTGAPGFAWSSISSSADGAKLIVTATHTYYTSGAIYTSADSGTNWMLTDAANNAWSFVASSADGNIAVAAAPYDSSAQVSVPLYCSTNAGIVWNPTRSLRKIWSVVASSADGNELVAISELGGIWMSQTTPSPQLNITASDTKLTFSWIVPSMNFVLQQSPDLISWSNVTNTPVLNLTNLNNELTLSASNSSGFFRLISQ